MCQKFSSKMFGRLHRRQITHDQISLPTEFMHIDGHSFVDQKVVDLDQARYDVLIERLKQSPATVSSKVACQYYAERSPRLLISHRCSHSRPAPSSRTGTARIAIPKISEPYGFVHVRHVTLENVSEESLYTTSADRKSSFDEDSSAADYPKSTSSQSFWDLLLIRLIE